MLDNDNKFILEKINIIYPYNQSIDYTNINSDTIFNSENQINDFKSIIFNCHNNDDNNQILMDFIIQCIIKCNF